MEIGSEKTVADQQFMQPSRPRRALPGVEDIKGRFNATQELRDGRQPLTRTVSPFRRNAALRVADKIKGLGF
jgi:hypothetical protein